ncbi:Endo-1, partial [Diplonema papillatum]
MKPKSNRKRGVPLSDVIEELNLATQAETLKNASSTAQLNLVFKLRELKEHLVTSEGPEDEKEALEAEVALLEDRLSLPRVEYSDSVFESNPLELSHLAVPEGVAAKRRKHAAHVLGFADQQSTTAVRKGGRLSLRRSNFRTAAQNVAQQQNLTRSFEQKINSFADLHNVLDQAQFGTHPLLQTGSTDAVQLLVVSDADHSEDAGMKDVPMPPLALVDGKALDEGGSNRAEQPIQQQNSGKSPRKAPDDCTDRNSGHDVHDRCDGRCVLLPPQKVLPSTVPLCHEHTCGHDRRNVRQDQIILGWNIVIDEEQLKKDIKKELPNVCCADVQYREDANKAGSFTAVLVFAYCDPPKADDMHSAPEKVPKTLKQCINVGKEVRSQTKPAESVHPPSLPRHLDDVRPTHAREVHASENHASFTSSQAKPQQGYTNVDWEEKVETFEAAATTEGTAAQRASMAATVAKFAEATDLQQAPAVFKLKAFAAAMVDGGMSEAQLAKFVARESGKRGRPRKGNMRTTSVESYLSALGPKMGVSAAEMKETKRALLKRRLERREMPDHAHPLTLEEARSVMHAAADMEVVAAAALLWGCALRMADLLEIKPEDVTLTARGVLRIAWWTTKEAKLRLREVEVLYQLPPLQREKVKRWIGLKQPFQRATIRHLLALARKLVPGCAEHSWKRGALQHLAKSGAQWDELLLIARHTSIATLRRYLWGCVTPDHTRTARNRATAPQGDEKAAPQSNRATAPQGNEKAAPQSNKTAAPQGNDKAAPQSNRATAPQGNEKAAPQSNKTAAPQGYDKAAPQSNRAAAPQGNEKAAPQSNKTATPQGNDKTAPQSNKAAAPQGNKDAAPQSDKTAVSP